MRHHDYLHDILVMPRDLIALAWSAPLRDLAAQLELSDVGLKKQLVSFGIPVPPQGYWNKVKANKPVPAMPDAEERRPGQIGRIAVNQRFKKLLPVAEPMSSEGPFKSVAVPELLDELFEQELRALGKISVPSTFRITDPSLMQILKKEEKRRAKVAATGWTYDGPKFGSPLAKRKFRVLNALFLALAKRKHTGSAYDVDDQIHVRAQIGDIFVGVELEIKGSLGRNDRRRLNELPDTTPLELWITPNFDRQPSRVWEDDRDGKLEDKIAAITASLIVAGEEKFRSDLRTREEDQRRRLEKQEQARIDRIKELNLLRLESLKISGELLRQADEIRSLVRGVRSAIMNGAQGIEPSDLADWERWALAEADRLDPILSGQFRSHLHDPTLGEEAEGKAR